MKKLVRAAFALMGLVGILAFGSAVSADEISVGDWVYLVENGTASIARYTGTDSEVTVPASAEIGGQNYRIRTIEAGAFENCNSISSLTIPEEITAIGHGAFRNCTMLGYLEIQGNLADCSKKSIGGNDEYFESDRSINNSVFYNTGNNAPEFKVVFADTVSRIPSYLFATSPDKGEDAYAHITSVEIGNGTAEIGEYAFYRCFGLKSVTFGDNLTGIGNYAFADDTSLTELSFNQLLFSIGEYAFAGNSSLSAVAFNPKLSAIGAGAFSSCNSLTSVIIPDSVTTIGEYAFENCSRLKDVEINGHEGIEVSLGAGAFRNCTFLQKVVVNAEIADCPSKSAKSNGEYYASDRTENNAVFYNTGNNADPFTVVFTDLVTRVPSYLFATGEENGDDVYAHLTEAVIGMNVKEIGDYAFYRCFNLKTVWMGNQVAEIGENAFGEDNLLETVEYTGEQSEWSDIAVEDPAEEAVSEESAAEEVPEAASEEPVVEEVPEAVSEESVAEEVPEAGSYPLSVLDQAGVLDETRASEYLDLIHAYTDKTGGWFLFFSTADTGNAEAFDKWAYFDQIVAAFADISKEEGGIAVVFNSKDGTIMADTYGRVGDQITDEMWDKFFSLMTRSGDITDNLTDALLEINSWF